MISRVNGSGSYGTGTIFLNYLTTSLDTNRWAELDVTNYRLVDSWDSKGFWISITFSNIVKVLLTNERNR